MINLNDVIQSAHGGQAIDTLSARFGLSPEQTQAAVSAVIPALQMGLQNKLEGGGLGSILSHFGNPANTQAYHDPGAAQSSATTAQGGSILGDLLGSGQKTTQVAQQVATESGVPASIIQAMLPVIASMLIGGLMHGAQGGGFGGILSSVLGSVLGQGNSPAAPTGSAPQGGGLGGMLGNVLGGLFGGGDESGVTSRPPTGAPYAPAPSTSEGTLAEISNMIESGSTSSPQHESALAHILGR